MLRTIGYPYSKLGKNGDLDAGSSELPATIRSPAVFDEVVLIRTC